MPRIKESETERKQPGGDCDYAILLEINPHGHSARYCMWVQYPDPEYSNVVVSLGPWYGNNYSALLQKALREAFGRVQQSVTQSVKGRKSETPAGSGDINGEKLAEVQVTPPAAAIEKPRMYLEHPRRNRPSGVNNDNWSLSQNVKDQCDTLSSKHRLILRLVEWDRTRRYDVEYSPELLEEVEDQKGVPYYLLRAGYLCAAGNSGVISC